MSTLLTLPGPRLVALVSTGSDTDGAGYAASRLPNADELAPAVASAGNETATCRPVEQRTRDRDKRTSFDGSGQRRQRNGAEHRCLEEVDAQVRHLLKRFARMRALSANQSHRTGRAVRSKTCSATAPPRSASRQIKGAAGAGGAADEACPEKRRGASRMRPLQLGPMVWFTW